MNRPQPARIAVHFPIVFASALPARDSREQVHVEIQRLQSAGVKPIARAQLLARKVARTRRLVRGAGVSSRDRIPATAAALLTRTPSLPSIPELHRKDAGLSGWPVLFGATLASPEAMRREEFRRRAGNSTIVGSPESTQRETRVRVPAKRVRLSQTDRAFRSASSHNAIRRVQKARCWMRCLADSGDGKRCYDWRLERPANNQLPVFEGCRNPCWLRRQDRLRKPDESASRR